MATLEIITQQFNNGPRKARDQSHDAKICVRLSLL